MKKARNNVSVSKGIPSETYLDFKAKQSDEWSCQKAEPRAGGANIQMNAIRLMGAKEVGLILGINPNAVYMLWRKRLLDYWNIHGTKKTNLNAIILFLEKTRNQELLLLDDGKE